MNDPMSRRKFLGLVAVSASATASLTLAGSKEASSPAGKLRLSACTEALFTVVPFAEHPAKWRPSAGNSNSSHVH